MLDETYELLSQQEDTYWWNTARRKTCIDLLEDQGVPENGRWLDLGSGTGGNLTLPAAFVPAEIVGAEISPLALKISRERYPQVRIEETDLNDPLPFPDNRFDVVTVFNVLYHDWVKDEAKVVAEIARVLRPGGYVVITEPAFPSLFRQMDVYCMGHRRYRIKNVEAWCKGAKLNVLRSTYFTSFGFPLILAEKFVHKLMGKKEAAVPPGLAEGHRLLNYGFNALAEGERFLISLGFRMPFGTTVLALAQKPPRPA